MKRRDFIRKTGVAAATLPWVSGASARARERPRVEIDRNADRPNILWIIAEDIGPQLGCYGASLVRTPNVDRLAEEGVRYTNVYTTSPVCSPSRSALITGMYQTSIGAHNHRTRDPRPLPPPVRPITDYFREAGYYTVNPHPEEKDKTPGAAGSGKTDLNFLGEEEVFDGRDWNEREPGQPFFAQLTIKESHSGPGWELARQQDDLVDPEQVELPPYYPDHPVVRDEVANYLDAINLMDTYVGEVLQRLEDEGIADNTVVIFFSDNGQGLVRGKQFCYDTGIHVPLIIRGPVGKLTPGTVDDQLISGIDIAATSLQIAGIRPPEHMHGRDVLRPYTEERRYIVSARDRDDICVDRIRCVRTKRFKYIRNFFPMIPYTQLNPYMAREFPTWNTLKDLHASGELNEAQSLFMADRKPVEELYDLAADPHEVNNLIDQEEYASTLVMMREILDDWIETTGDQGAVIEDPLTVFRSYYGSLDPDEARPERRRRAYRAYYGEFGPEYELPRE